VRKSIWLTPWLLEGIAAITLLLIWVSAGANPTPIPENLSDSIYMSSEKLTVTVSEDTARLAGTFTFRYHGHGPAPGWRPFVRLEIPVWFPAQDARDSTVAAFWKTFPKYDIVEITPETRGAFQKALDLQVSLGDEPLQVKQFSSFTTSTNTWADEPGFFCIVLKFYIEDGTKLAEKPLQLSYRQPLRHTNDEAVFYYVPMFENLPAGARTTNTNRYSITIVDQAGVSLMVSDSQRSTVLSSGGSVVLSPRHHQAIRAVVKQTSK
jgi:hypothetical protein